MLEANKLYLSGSRSFRSSELLSERRAMLRTQPAAQPLRKWCRRIESDKTLALPYPVVVPDIDPAEAGTQARVLILLEAPGPMSNSFGEKAGSGFISIDNDDRSAQNCWDARQKSGLGADITLHWNIVPWYLGPASRKPNADELRKGAAKVVELIEHLPLLEVVILCGRVAQKGWKNHVSVVWKLRCEPDSVQNVFESWHPSPLALSSIARRQEFHSTFASAAALIKHKDVCGKL